MRLRGFYLSILSLLCLHVTLFAQQCQTPFQGTWITNDAGGLFYLLTADDFRDANGGYSVSGTVSGPTESCIQKAPLTGYVSGVDGSYRGHVDLSGTDCDNAYWDDFLDPPSLQACNQMFGYYNSELGGDTEYPFNLSKPCATPDYEQVFASQWNADQETQVNFHVTARHYGGELFGGRTISEIPNGFGVDQCWFPDSPFETRDIGPFRSWTLGWDNSYIDTHGFTVAQVNLYQARSDLPCSYIIPQRLQILCSQYLSTPYDDPYISATITDAALSVCRRDKCGAQLWPPSI